MTEYYLKAVEKGVFRPQIPVRSILLFARSFIDGIAQSTAMRMTEDGDDEEPGADVRELFRTLAKAVTGFLGV